MFLKRLILALLILFDLLFLPVIFWRWFYGSGTDKLEVIVIAYGYALLQIPICIWGICHSGRLKEQSLKIWSVVHLVFTVAIWMHSCAPPRH